MLHKRFRLTKAVDFERLYGEGQRWHHELAILITKPNGLDISRYGFSTSKRVGKAVDRNHVKRRFREVVRRRLGEVKPGWDCLFIIKPLAIRATSSEIEAAVISLVDRALFARNAIVPSKGNLGLNLKE